MARTFVRISLATKFRVLFASAVVVIIATALAVPWWVTERLVDDAAAGEARQIASLGLAEWVQRHPDPAAERGELARYFTEQAQGRRGPNFVALVPSQTQPAMDSAARRALTTFRHDGDRKLVLISEREQEGERVYRCFRAVRATAQCRRCHHGGDPDAKAFQPDQLVGMIDVSFPPAPGALVWWTRGIFAVGGVMAALLAFAILYSIARRTILVPLGSLHELAEGVAEGDLTQRSSLTTGDEFEQLGQRFNEMLEAIQTQQGQLRQANRALDLRLSEMAESNVSLYEANRIKNEFLANVSHELRTPLNSIIGFAELLAESDDEKRRRHATHILTSARMLLRIINDLLDLAKIEAGKTDLRLERVSVRDLCETLGQLVHPMADKKRLALEVETSPELPILRTDPGKVQQVLYNLLSNAIKFTPPGGSVKLSAAGVEPGDAPIAGGGVAVAVADTGPGIPVADQQLIFEKFRRLDDSITRAHGGAGLGLGIARELANLLGGKLTLESEPGHGATFTLLLPLNPPEAAPPEQPPQGG